LIQNKFINLSWIQATTFFEKICTSIEVLLILHFVENICYKMNHITEQWFCF